MFKKEWFKNNKLEGARLADVQSQVAASWKQLSADEKQVYEDCAKAETTKPKTLNESEDVRNNKRRKYLHSVNSTLDLLSAECGLESIVISGSRLAGEQFSVLTGTSRGLQAMRALDIKDLPLNLETQIQHDAMHGKY
jgi:hypothetical protein